MRFGHHNLRFLPLLFAALIADDASADPPVSPNDSLSQIALFNRCYATITRQRLSKTHRFYAAVKTGQLTATDACIAVLESGSFDRAPEDAAEKVAVEQTFSDFHRTWFPADNYVNTLPLGEIHTPNTWYRDPAEPAHYVTRAMFAASVPFSTILTETSGMIATRSPGTPIPGSIGNGFPMGLGFVNNQNQPQPFNPPFHNVGDVVGVQRTADNPAYMGAQIPDPLAWAKSIPVFQHFGGGLLGSQAYLMLNFGRGEENNDGGLKTARRWAKAVMQDVMCRDIPAARVEDIRAMVDPSSPLPFRKQASCMQCHGVLDPIASVTRNLRYLSFPNDRVTLWNTIHMVQYDATGGADFWTQAPTGKVMYRNFDGDLIKGDVNNIQGLGEFLAQQEDPYVCAAARYFELFTGMRVSLQDPGDPNNPKLAPGDVYYRDLVIAMGREFKKHQSIVTLIREIIEADFYKLAGMRRAVSVE